MKKIIQDGLVFFFKYCKQGQFQLCCFRCYHFTGKTRSTGATYGAELGERGKSNPAVWAAEEVSTEMDGTTLHAS
ncbi:hypothetical protein D3C80_428540 [compost metagenome]